MRQVIIYPGEDGYWVVECLSLPACISQGKTKEEAIANIKKAIHIERTTELGTSMVSIIVESTCLE